MKASALYWLFALALLGLVAAARAIRDHFDAAAPQASVESAAAAGPVTFIAIYAVATVLLHYKKSDKDAVAPALVATEPLGNAERWSSFEPRELRICRAGPSVSRIATNPRYASVIVNHA